MVTSTSLFVHFILRRRLCQGSTPPPTVHCRPSETNVPCGQTALLKYPPTLFTLGMNFGSKKLVRTSTLIPLHLPRVPHSSQFPQSCFAFPPYLCNPHPPFYYFTTPASLNYEPGVCFKISRKLNFPTAVPAYPEKRFPCFLSFTFPEENLHR